jgi:hypothetical protein
MTSELRAMVGGLGESSEGATGLEPRITEYWSWVAVALYLLVTVDLLTTLYAAAAVGTEAEANPLVAWLIAQPVSVLVTVNLTTVVLVAAFFYGVMEMLRATPPRARPYFAGVIELWLGGLIAVGLFVFANNLSVIVLGRGLLG